MAKNKIDNLGQKGKDNVWKKGGPTPNPNGRPNGQRNYATIYKEALIKLGTLNGKTPDELEEEIISKGILNARSGNYSFYKDVLDRLHGQAIASTDITSGGKPIGSIEALEELNAKFDTFISKQDTTPSSD